MAPRTLEFSHDVYFFIKEKEKRELLKDLAREVNSVNGNCMQHEILGG